MKIACVTGSRSDRNAIEIVAAALSAAKHESRVVDISSSLPAGNTVTRVVQAMLACRSLGALGTSCDLVVLHGDRHEIMGAAMTANVMGVPIAHLGGGDLTEGSQDDCFRHAITKLAHLHFPANQDAADRIIQMGEDPKCVHVTGDAGIDAVHLAGIRRREDTFAEVGLMSWRSPAPTRVILVLFHPSTLGDTRAELNELIIALERQPADVSLVLLGPNDDVGADLVRDAWRGMAHSRPNTVYHERVSPKTFYSLLNWCTVLVGNSSAAYYEAPVLNCAAVDIGDRQTGRAASSNIVRCRAEAGEIASAIHYALAWNVDPNRLRSNRIGGFYGDGHAAPRIANVIGEIKDARALLRKRFCSMPWCGVTLTMNSIQEEAGP